MAMTSAEYRRYRKEHHRCVQCNTKDAYTEAGRSYCAVCTEKNNAYRREHYAEIRERKQARARALRKERKEAGLCPTCGIRKPADGRVQCKVCLADRRKRQEKYRRDHGIIPRYMFHTLGLCQRCGDPLEDPEKMQCNKCTEYFASIRWTGKPDNGFTRGNEKYWRGRRRKHKNETD